MSIFNLHSSVLADYRDFVRSFFTVADDRASEFIDVEWVELRPSNAATSMPPEPTNARLASPRATNV